MDDPTGLATLELHPDRPADAAVIWLHGLGATYHDFAPVPPELGLPADAAVRWIFPQAPSIPVTINNWMTMPAWYDIVSLESRGTDERGLRRSAAAIEALVAREVARGVDAARIVLGGFSMGAALALFVGLRRAARPAGLFALSGYLPLTELLDAEASAAARGVPVFVAHGSRDPLVPPELGRAAAEALAARGHPVERREYPIEHSCSIEELRDLGAWLAGVLGY